MWPQNVIFVMFVILLFLAGFCLAGGPFLLIEVVDSIEKLKNKNGH